MNRRALLGWMAVLPFAPYLASAFQKETSMLPVAAASDPVWTSSVSAEALLTQTWWWSWNIEKLAVRHIKR